MMGIVNAAAISTDFEEDVSDRRRIFVVEDHAFMRKSIVSSIERNASLSVCGEAADSDEALQAIVALVPDLVLTDLQLKTSSGIDLIAALRSHFPTLPIVATTMFDVSANEQMARSAGATDFVSKFEGPDVMNQAILNALDGGPGLSGQES